MIKANKLSVNQRWLIGIVIIINLFLCMDLAGLKYFMLDNPTMLYCMPTTFINRLFFTETVRFMPFTFMIQRIASILFGNYPATYYMINVLFVMMAEIGLYMFGRLMVPKKKTEIILLGISLLFVTSFTENMYTIGKMEITLVCFFVLFFYLIGSYMMNDYSRIHNTGILLSYEFVILGLLLTKETSVIIVAPAIIVLIYCIIFNKNKIGKAFWMTGILLINITLYMVYRHFYVVKGAYTTYSMSLGLIIDNFRFYLQYHYDIYIIGIVSGICGILYFFRSDRNLKSVILLAANISGWGYLLGISLWKSPQSYYVYPAAVLFLISFCSVFLIDFSKILKAVLSVVLGVAVVSAFIYNYKVAVATKLAGNSYTNSIEQVMELTGDENARILMENYSFYTEQVYQTGLLLKYLNSNCEVYGIHPIGGGLTDEQLAAYGYTLQDYNILKDKLIPQEGDYILIYNNDIEFRGPIRGVNPSKSFNADSKRLEESGYHLELEANDIERNNLLHMKAEYWIYRIRAS